MLGLFGRRLVKALAGLILGLLLLLGQTIDLSRPASCRPLASRAKCHCSSCDTPDCCSVKSAPSSTPLLPVVLSGVAIDESIPLPVLLQVFAEQPSNAFPFHATAPSVSGCGVVPLFQRNCALLI